MVSKKGNAILDSITFLVVIFAFVIITIFAVQMSDFVTEAVIAEDDINTEAKTQLTDLNDRYPSYFDGLITFVIFALWFALVVASFKIDAHPIFFVATIILAIFVIILGAIFANTLEEINNDPDISEYAAQLPKTTWLAANYPYVALVMIFSVIIVLFGKERI